MGVLVLLVRSMTGGWYQVAVYLGDDTAGAVDLKSIILNNLVSILYSSSLFIFVNHI